MQHLANRISGSGMFSKLFRKYFISYATVLLIPILICSFYYHRSYAELRQRATTVQHLVLESVGQRFNGAMLNSVNLRSHLSLNKYVGALANGRCTVDSSPVADRLFLQQDLRALQVSNALLQDLCVYTYADNYVTSARSSYTLSLLPYMEASSNRLSAADWVSIKSTLTYRSFVCLTDEEKNFVAVALPLVYSRAGSISAVLCIQLDKHELLQYMETQKLLNYPCAVALAADDTLLLCTDDPENVLSALPLETVFDYFEENGTDRFYEMTGPEPLFVSCYTLHTSSLRLVAAVQKEDFQLQLRYLREIMLLTFCVCLLVGLLVTVHYARQSYQPVSNIVQYIHRDDDGDAAPQGEEPVQQDEYHYILQTLIRNHSELTRQREWLKSSYLQKLLTGELSFRQLPEPIIRQFSLSLPDERLCVAAISAETLGCFAQTQNAAGNVNYAIENVYRELLGSTFTKVYFSTQPQKLSVLMYLPDSLSDEQALHVATSKAETLAAFMEKTFHIPLCTGVSAVQMQDEIPTAYLQASSAQEYCRLFSEQGARRFDQLPVDQNIGSLPLHSSEYVINLLLENNQSQLTEYFKTLASELKLHSLSLNDANALYYFFYHSTAKLQLYCRTQYDRSIEALKTLDRSVFQQSLFAALTKTEELYLAAAAEIALCRQNGPQNNWGRSICRYIESNYFNSNLNIAALAEQFQLSPSYLSKRFREQYQTGVIDYLYEVRIRNAVTMLEQTDLKITDIAQTTGFIDSNAFIRIFKKVKGITPGKYRESLLLNENCPSSPKDSR